VTLKNGTLGGVSWSSDGRFYREVSEAYSIPLIDLYYILKMSEEKKSDNVN